MDQKVEQPVKGLCEGTSRMGWAVGGEGRRELSTWSRGWRAGKWDGGGSRAMQEGPEVTGLVWP